MLGPPAVPSRPKLNAVTGHWTIGAEHRRGRPAAGAPCVFCPGQEGRTPPTSHQVPATGPWRARAFANGYPVLPFHELVVDSPRHVACLHELTEPEVREALRLWAQRLQAAAPFGRCRMVYRNDGPRAGASVPHSHAHVVAGDVLPRLLREADAFGDRCPFESGAFWSDRIEHVGSLILAEPEAARFPGETWIFPESHAARFEETDTSTLTLLADILLGEVKRLAARGVDAYNIGIHTSPDHVDDFHWHVEILPRRQEVGGLELAADLFVNEGL